MDVVLFNPAPRGGKQTQRRVEIPLGLLCPASPVDRLGFRVRLIDEFDNPRWKGQLLEALSERPLCFGVTSMTGPQILHAMAACRIVRGQYPDVPIVWGGIHASLMPEQTLQNPLVDIVVIGEGEATFPELVQALASGTPLEAVAGIAFRKDGDCRFTGERGFIDLDREPFLSYHLLDMDHYRRRLFGQDHISINSSRGCKRRCKFCWDPVMHKRSWRAMSPETVLEHLRRILRDYGIRGFLFTDDNFFTDLSRARGILEALVRADLGVSIGKLQIRADTVCRMDGDFFDLLVRVGVRRLMLGIESGSQRVLDMVAKDLQVEQVVEAGRKLKAYPIVPVYLFMMGLPTETPDEFAQSIRLATQLTDENPRAVKTFNIFTPYPGTQMYEVAVQLGLRPPTRLEDWARFNFHNLCGRAPWLPPETRRLIEGLDFPLMFLGKGTYVTPYKKTPPLVVALSRMYYPLARYRVAHMNARWPIESKLVKALGLFARPD
jgi:anaerobic magnesium-protoporphyrin IX monomethyl ester cyclase